MNYIVGIGEILWDMLPEGKQLGGRSHKFRIPRIAGRYARHRIKRNRI